MLTVVVYYFRGIPPGTLVMYHFKTNVFIPELGKGIFTTFTYISVFSKMDATSPLTITLLYIQKIYFSAIKLCLEYVKFFRVPGV